MPLLRRGSFPRGLAFWLSMVLMFADESAFIGATAFNRRVFQLHIPQQVPLQSRFQNGISP
jgi:hypothetical protein